MVGMAILLRHIADELEKAGAIQFEINTDIGDLIFQANVVIFNPHKNMMDGDSVTFSLDAVWRGRPNG